MGGDDVTDTDQLVAIVREALIVLRDGSLTVSMASNAPPALAALDSLAAELIDKSEWREGIVSVYDHEGNYAGCMGSETWQWTLDGGIAELRAELERVKAEREGEA
jgi:hypothetical protein